MSLGAAAKVRDTGRAIWGSRTGLLDQRAFPRNAGGIHAAQSPGSVTRRNRMATTLDWQPDSLEGYQQQVFELGQDPDGEGEVAAVLVRRQPRADEAVHGAVLYVHGFTDYFFQTELADFFAARGLAFYALDLRKCGRARRAGQTAHYVSDLACYDEELERALTAVAEARPGAP